MASKSAQRRTTINHCKLFVARCIAECKTSKRIVLKSCK